MTTIFETPRLAFRPFQTGDLEDLARLSADPVASQFVGDGSPLSWTETQVWIENSRRNVDRYGYGTGALTLRDTGALIGWAGIARPGDGTEELIYGFDRAVWGRGLGSELLPALVAWARDTLALAELRATVDPGNVASIAMLRRVGFRLVDDRHGGDPQAHLYVLTFLPAGSAAGSSAGSTGEGQT